MTAASWAVKAADLSDREDEWKNYLTLGRMSDYVDLSETTLKDLLTRDYAETDPRHQLRQPVGRIGGLAGAMPLWSYDQADAYLAAKAQRDKARLAEQSDPGLPVVAMPEASERGLVTTDELVTITGRTKTQINRWIRRWPASTDHPFPPKVGVAARVAPIHKGPWRPLRVLADVQEWITERERRDSTDRAPGRRAAAGA